MLTNWNPARMPEKDEMKLRLSTARKQLYDLQMKIKEHKIPVIVLFEGFYADREERTKRTGAGSSGKQGYKMARFPVRSVGKCTL